MDIAKYAKTLADRLQQNARARREIQKVRNASLDFAVEEANQDLLKSVQQENDSLAAAEKNIDAVDTVIYKAMKLAISTAFEEHGFPDPFETDYNIFEVVSKDLESIGHFDCCITNLRDFASYFAKTFPFVRGYKEDRTVEENLVKYHHLLAEVSPFVHDSFELARNLDMYKVKVRNRSLLKGNLGFALVYATEIAMVGALLYLSSQDAKNAAEYAASIGMIGGSGMLLMGMSYMFAVGMQGRFYTQLKGQAERTQNLIERIKEAQ